MIETHQLGSLDLVSQSRLAVALIALKCVRNKVRMKTSAILECFLPNRKIQSPNINGIGWFNCISAFNQTQAFASAPSFKSRPKALKPGWRVPLKSRRGWATYKHDIWV